MSGPVEGAIQRVLEDAGLTANVHARAIDSDRGVASLAVEHLATADS